MAPATVEGGHAFALVGRSRGGSRVCLFFERRLGQRVHAGRRARGLVRRADGLGDRARRAVYRSDRVPAGLRAIRELRCDRPGRGRGSRGLSSAARLHPTMRARRLGAGKQLGVREQLGRHQQLRVRLRRRQRRIEQWLELGKWIWGRFERRRLLQLRQQRRSRLLLLQHRVGLAVEHDDVLHELAPGPRRVLRGPGLAVDRNVHVQLLLVRGQPGRRVRLLLQRQERHPRYPCDVRERRCLLPARRWHLQLLRRQQQGLLHGLHDGLVVHRLGAGSVQRPGLARPNPGAVLPVDVSSVRSGRPAAAGTAERGSRRYRRKLRCERGHASSAPW